MVTTTGLSGAAVGRATVIAQSAARSEKGSRREEYAKDQDDDRGHDDDG